MGSRAHRPCTAHAIQSVFSIGYESAVAHCGRKNQQGDCAPPQRHARSIPGETVENLQTVGDLEEICGSKLFHTVGTRRLVKCGPLGEGRLALFQLNPIRFSIEIDSPRLRRLQNQPNCSEFTPSLRGLSRPDTCCLSYLLDGVGRFGSTMQV